MSLKERHIRSLVDVLATLEKASNIFEVRKWTYLKLILYISHSLKSALGLTAIPVDIMDAVGSYGPDREIGCDGYFFDGDFPLGYT